ncbi:tRNA nucleotidyltransferase/poly(A) polymerase [Fonticella tunisiensis]|uniref:tRNA nucleotidyltransferase/poly(A) polymerase n=2 Tax=Fonticella tunisiensis TaxID=1096341 RepID=A0A4R7KRK3_9CLOT|nr:tRNA nucleotidyltransferase/poly(A) polymerase [Fonticella tunisiensis]
MLNLQKYDIIGLFSKIFNSMNLRAYLVGGAVRDMYLGIVPLDFDFVVEIGEEEHLNAFEKITSILKCKSKYNSYYHTGKFSINGEDVDFIMARDESYSGIASKPRVWSSNIIKDLGRRDFTINSIAVSLYGDEYGRIIDPFNGLLDLKRKKIRVLHDKSFMDDPTRIFRGIKYLSRFDFEFDRKTYELILCAIERGAMLYLKSERVRQELEKILEEKNIYKGIKYIKKTKILNSVIGKEVFINTCFDEASFLNLKFKNKLAVLLYRNSIDIIKEIEEYLKPGASFSDLCLKIKELKEATLKQDDSLYTSLFNCQNVVADEILRTLFKKDKRIDGFLRFKKIVKLSRHQFDKANKRGEGQDFIDVKLDALYSFLRGELNGYNKL